MAQSFEAQDTEAIRAKHSYLEYLTSLVDGALEARDNKGLMKHVKSARFPLSKSLREFNFDFQPKLDVRLIKTLAACDFVERRENVILVGQPGTGTTHLAIALGQLACKKGLDVRFTTVQDLAADLRAAQADHTGEQRIDAFVEPDLVILDEHGFTPLDRLLADAFYHTSPAAKRRRASSSRATRASNRGARCSPIR